MRSSLKKGIAIESFSFWTRKTKLKSAHSSQLGRKPEFDVLFPAGQHRDLDRSDAPQGLDHVVDQNVGRRGARRDADGFRILEPIRVELVPIANEETAKPNS